MAKVKEILSNPSPDDWSLLASRAMRVLLARRGMSFAEAASAMTTKALPVSTRSIDGRVQRGSFECSFFLQAIYATGADYPCQWVPFLSKVGKAKSQATWSTCATALMAAEQQSWANFTYEGFSQRLESIGVHLAPEVIKYQVTQGNYPMTLLLQYAAVSWVDGLELFLDRADILRAGRAAILNAAGPQVSP
ncbi:DUF6471 domain-containing protein [Caballeronia sp. NCTM5]|uniref:DUF6471 domain-containing protein n=1 Tax=Caballeronia sp. NCTM5 TaxID=2921755 RepID=UPI0032EBF798